MPWPALQNISLHGDGQLGISTLYVAEISELFSKRLAHSAVLISFPKPETHVYLQKF